jgi:thymidylate kinase
VPGFTIALLGPDGSGKTTVARRLIEALGPDARYMYMSINPASGNHVLPTTRLAWVLRGRPEHIEGLRRRHSSRVVGVGAELLALANQVAEECYRLLIARWHVLRGRMVVFDRHYYFDYYATDVVAAERRWEDRLHGLVLQRLPRPDLPLYLDAPPEVLHARKGEGTLESLTALRHDLLAAVASHPDSVIVDGNAPVDDVVQALLAAIRAFRAQRGEESPDRRRARRAASPAAERTIRRPRRRAGSGSDDDHVEWTAPGA